MNDIGSQRRTYRIRAWFPRSTWRTRRVKRGAPEKQQAAQALAWRRPGGRPQDRDETDRKRPVNQHAFAIGLFAIHTARRAGHAGLRGARRLGNLRDNTTAANIVLIE